MHIILIGRHVTVLAFHTRLGTASVVTLFRKPPTRDCLVVGVDAKHLQMRSYGNDGSFTP